MKPTFDSLSSEKTFSLSELLPYDPKVKSGVRLLSGLKEYLLILQATEEAIECIRREEIDNFDPLVGETACQIRAIKIADVFHTLNLNYTISEKIKYAKEKINLIISDDLFLKTTNNSLHDLLILENIDIQTNENMIFMIRSYFLSKIKAPVKQNNIDTFITKPKLIRNISPVGIDYAERFVRKLRVDLSGSSVNFIQQISKTLPSNELCVRMVSEQFSIRHIGLQCIPYYWTTQILMQYALAREIPIVLLAEQKATDKNYQTIRKTLFCFEATSTGYQRTEYITPHLDKPAIIVCGTSNANLQALPSQAQWVQELKEHNIIELILAHAASHPQYPDKLKEVMLQNIQDSSYQYYKEKADAWGCSMKNPSLFFIIHIFCDKVRNFIQRQTILPAQEDLTTASSMLLEDMTVS